MTALADLPFPIAHDGYGNRVAPSGIVTARYNSDGSRCALHTRDSSPWRLYDRTEYAEGLVRDNQWTAVIHYDGRRNTLGESDVTGIPGLDCGARVWTLVTQGVAKGGRRYRHCLTLAEAQTAAFAWLDRRYAVVEVDA